MSEPIREPDLPVLESGHNIESTVFVECATFYRAGVSNRLSFIGETEFVNGVAQGASAEEKAWLFRNTACTFYPSAS